MISFARFGATAGVILLSAATAPAQTLTGEALVKALRQGGYVIVMRHASSPTQRPAKETADAANTNLERQLDETGRSTATAMGKALRDLKIPIGEVFTSPTYRALETIRFEGWSNPKPVPELGDNGRSMQGGTAAQAAWLQQKVTQFPKGTNTVIVTHLPNLTGAFPKESQGAQDGESLIFGPDGKAGATLVARVRITDWPAMHF